MAEMHHHAAGAGDAPIRLFFLLLVVLATAIHLCARCGHAPGGNRFAWGHVLMGAGMACMFLPDHWKPVPDIGWETVFCSVVGSSALAAARAWGAGELNTVPHHADVVIGGIAMVSMYARLGLAHVPLTGLLGAYFAAQVVSAGGLLLWRATVIDLPESWASGSSHEPEQHRVTLAPRAAPTRSVAARFMMAAAMLYMLAAA